MQAAAVHVRAAGRADQDPEPGRRHEHEWQVWEDVPLPDDKVLIPGVMETTSNYIEHPELVAQRVERYAKVVGRERVLAERDCGFGSLVGMRATAPSIAWAKLETMAEGARLASSRLRRHALACGRRRPRVSWAGQRFEPLLQSSASQFLASELAGGR